jgi:hypothetical protein
MNRRSASSGQAAVKAPASPRKRLIPMGSRRSGTPGQTRTSRLWIVRSGRAWRMMKEEPPKPVPTSTAVPPGGQFRASSEIRALSLGESPAGAVMMAWMFIGFLRG